MRRTLAISATTIGVAAALALAAPSAASANEATTPPVSIPGGDLTAYAYIQDHSDANNCGAFTTSADTTTPVGTLTNSVQWDPVGIGASAEILGTGLSINGGEGASPNAEITGTDTSYVSVRGTACMSWSTMYLGVHSTATTQISNTLYTTTAHL